MNPPKLNFFESPPSPLTGQFDLQRLPVCSSALQPPPADDLRWLRVEQWLAAKSLSANTRRAYRKELKRFWNWTDQPWSQITPWQVTRYKIDLETATRPDPATSIPKPQLSTNSVALAVRALKSFFRWMQQSHYIRENPTLAVSAPSEPEPESKELTELQVQAVYAALAQPSDSRCRDTALLAVLNHGLRAAEASHLDVQDYNHKRLHVRSAKQGSTGRVPLDKAACAALDTYLEERKAQGESLTAETPLFVNYSRDAKARGKRLSYDGVYWIVKQLGQRAISLALEALPDLPESLAVADRVGWEVAALDNLHPHQFRHTFASNLVLEGLDTYLAMALTRHRSISVFRRYSSKAREKQAERAFRQLRGEGGADD